MSLWKKYGWLAYTAVFVGVLGHASTEFVATLSGVKGPELSVWRFVLGSLGLIAVSLALPGSRNLLEPLRTHLIKLLGLSLLGVTGGYLLFHWSLDFASVPQVATLVTTIPIFVALSNLIINRQPISTAKIASGLCALIGISLLITDGYLAKLAGSTDSLLGIMLALGCSAAVAAYSVMIRPIIGQYGALRITAITMFIGSIGLWGVVGYCFMEHHNYPISLDWWVGCSSRHNQRELYFLFKTGYCRPSGHFDPQAGVDWYTAICYFGDHRISCRRGFDTQVN